MDEEPVEPGGVSYTTKREVIDELGDEYEHDMMVVDGHDEAILGTVENAEGYTVVAYSKGGIVEGLVRQGMTLEQALEFFDYNIAGHTLEWARRYSLTTRIFGGGNELAT